MSIKNVLNHSGRSLLALYFLIPGVMKLLAWDMHIALMEKHSMVMAPILLVIAATIQILASISLLLNRNVVTCALGLAVMVLVINFNLHDFWNYSDIEGAHETQNFVKNLGIFAGLLLLASMNMQEPSTNT